MAKLSEKKMVAELRKWKWLAAYETVIHSRLKGCRRKPTWQHLPAGHMYLAQGMTPKKAADKYLAETVFGRQACAKKNRKGHRR